MNPLLKQVKNIYQEGCVSIILKTHRTHPENANDPIELKNLVKEATDRLLNDYDKRSAAPTIERINTLADSIDHQHNLEGLVLFANSDFADFTRIAVDVENRVVIDDTFATRDLVRAAHEQEAYYALALSRNEARLIEAMSDKPVQELKGNFPYKNDTLFNTDKGARHTAGSDEKLIEEFFNRVDKEVQAATKEHRLPVFVVCEERNFQHFMNVADNKDMYVANVAKSRDDEAAKLHHIIDEAWPEVHQFNRDKNANRLEELGAALGTGKFESDYNEIWRAIQAGRGQTLFVKKGHFQPAIIADNEIVLVDKTEKDQKGIVDDIIDELIEQTMAFGGDVVFVDSSDLLQKMQNVALITRY